MPPKPLNDALITLLVSTHQATTLWGVAEKRTPWGRPMGRVERVEAGGVQATLMGCKGAHTAHEELSARARQADAVAVGAALFAVLDSLPPLRGRPIRLGLCHPTKSSKAPAFTCHVEGVLLGNTETPTTASTLATKLVKAADHLSALGWATSDPLWTLTEGQTCLNTITIQAPNLETAQIKLAVWRNAGKPLDAALSAAPEHMAQIHEPNPVRRDLLRAALRNR